MRAFCIAVSLICGLLWARTALGVEIARDGMSFSDEGGGFTLKSVTGHGSLIDPYVIVEDVAGPHAVLVIRHFKQVGNRIDTYHVAGIAVTKIVFNRSKDIWQNYQLELREVLTRHSSYKDGLSFAQNTEMTNTFTTSTFPNLQRYDEPQDTLGFSGKSVLPGDSAQFSFLITDMSPVDKIYLLQDPLQPVSDLSPGGSRSHAFRASVDRGERRLAVLGKPRDQAPLHQRQLALTFLVLAHDRQGSGRRGIVIDRPVRNLAIGPKPLPDGFRGHGDGVASAHLFPQSVSFEDINLNVS